MGDLDLILSRICRVARSGRPLALLFDYDGTLAPIRPSPSEAVLPAATSRALHRLADNPRNVVGIISGRALNDLQGMVGLDNLYYSGTSGLEIDYRGRVQLPPGIHAARAPLDQAEGRLREIVARYPGAWLEQKPFGATLHYRLVAPERRAMLRMEVAEAVQLWGDRLKIEDISLGLEIVPNIGWNKGTAVKAFVDQLDDEPFAIYAGDSANDAPALAAVDEMGGLSIGVGPTACRASAWVHGPAAVGALAIMLAVALYDADCLCEASSAN